MRAISIVAATTNLPVPHPPPPHPHMHDITVSFIDLNIEIITHSCARKCVLWLRRTMLLVKCVCPSRDHASPCLAPRSCCPGAVFPHKTLEHAVWHGFLSLPRPHGACHLHPRNLPTSWHLPSVEAVIVNETLINFFQGKYV